MLRHHRIHSKRACLLFSSRSASSCEPAAVEGCCVARHHPLLRLVLLLRQLVLTLHPDCQAFAREPCSVLNWSTVCRYQLSMLVLGCQTQLTGGGTVEIMRSRGTQRAQGALNGLDSNHHGCGTRGGASPRHNASAPRASSRDLTKRQWRSQGRARVPYGRVAR